MTPLLYRFHAWLGLVTGLFLILISLSGALLVFKPEIDHALNPALFAVEPTTTALPVAALWDSAREAYPDAQLVGFFTPHDVTQVYTFLVKEGNRYNDVQVDPYSGRILGARNRPDTLADVLRQFHVRLWMGFWGRVFVGCFGVTLLISTITGLVIYFKFNKWFWLPRIRWGSRPRVVIADLHKAVGLSTALLNVVFAISGAVLGLENLHTWYTRPPRAAQQAKAAAKEKTDAEPTPWSGQMVQACLGRAQKLLPGTTPSRVLTGRNQLRVYVAHPDLEFLSDAASYVEFSPAGETTQVYNANQAPFWERAYYTMEPLHFGRFGGLPVKIFYSFAGLAAGLLSLSGFAIYVARRWGSPARSRNNIARQTFPAAALATAGSSG
jgi:uncharacterized iron-regulated membrane protein